MLANVPLAKADHVTKLKGIVGGDYKTQIRGGRVLPEGPLMGVPHKK